MPPTPLQMVIQNREKLQGLPPAKQQQFADYLFRKFLLPQMMNVPEEYQERARKQFSDRLLTGKMKPLDDTPTKADRESAGQDTGLKGVLQGGLMEGLSNMATAGEKLSSLPGAGGEKSAALLRNSADELHQVADINKTASADYAKENPVKSFVTDMAGQSAPAIPFGLATGGAASAAGAGGLIPAAVGGATEMQSFDPGLRGAVTGAAAPYVMKGAGKVISKLAKPVMGKIGELVASATSKIPSKAGSTTTGLGSEFVQGLEKKAQAEFQKPFAELLPDQKAKIVNASREEAVAAENLARTEKAKAKKQALIDSAGAESQQKIKAEKAKLDAKVATKVERDRLRDEAKLVAQGAAKFRKIMKRAPTEEELGKIREAVKNAPKIDTASVAPSVAPAPAAAAPPTPQPQPQAAAAAAPAKAPVVEVSKPVVPQPERRAAVRSDTSQMVLNKLHGELRAETDPTKKLEIQAAIQRESTQGSPEEINRFKVESPEAIKAAEAFTSFAKDPVTGITKVPEGVHGSGFETNKDALARVDQVIDKPDAATKLEAVKADPVGEGKKGKNADRKAVERATAAAQAAIPTHAVGGGDSSLAAIEKVAGSAKSPEEHMIALERAYEYTAKKISEIKGDEKAGKMLVDSFKKAARLSKWDSATTLEHLLEALQKIEAKAGEAK